jgi:hypothetical protein
MFPLQCQWFDLVYQLPLIFFSLGLRCFKKIMSSPQCQTHAHMGGNEPARGGGGFSSKGYFSLTAQRSCLISSNLFFGF